MSPSESSLPDRTPLQNRVTPFGDLVAVPERGDFMGNRGVLHDDGRRVVRSSAERRWICCLTEFRGRRRVLMAPGRYTELFFLDEATALAAGHRPCWECRRADALAFRAAWARASERDGAISFAELDALLHAERLEGRGRMRRWTGDAAALPDGAMIERDGSALLVWREELLEWTAAGYAGRRPRSPGPATVLTPRSIVGAIEAGYAPAVHPSHAVRPGWGRTVGVGPGSGGASPGSGSTPWASVPAGRRNRCCAACLETPYSAAAPPG